MWCDVMWCDVMQFFISYIALTCSCKCFVCSIVLCTYYIVQFDTQLMWPSVFLRYSNKHLEMNAHTKQSRLMNDNVMWWCDVMLCDVMQFFILYIAFTCICKCFACIVLYTYYIVLFDMQFYILYMHSQVCDCLMGPPTLKNIRLMWQCS